MKIWSVALWYIHISREDEIIMYVGVSFSAVNLNLRSENISDITADNFSVLLFLLSSQTKNFQLKIPPIAWQGKINKQVTESQIFGLYGNLKNCITNASSFISHRIQWKVKIIIYVYVELTPSKKQPTESITDKSRRCCHLLQNIRGNSFLS